jgi:hypothetical protein
VGDAAGKCFVQDFSLSPPNRREKQGFSRSFNHLAGGFRLQAAPAGLGE